MDHIPAREWTANGNGSTVQHNATFPGDVALLTVTRAGRNTTFVMLTADQLAEKITDEIRRLALMRGRQAAVEAVAAAVPETRLRGRTEWELTEKAHDALRPAEGADVPVGGGSTPGAGDEAGHGPASHPEPVRLLYVTPANPTTIAPVHDELYEAMRAALSAGTPEPRYRGVHTCACGARSTNFDVQLPSGAWTNTLAPHYLAWHRHEIPTDELERVARHLRVDLP